MVRIVETVNSRNSNENQLNIQTRSEISFDGSEESSPKSILSTLNEQDGLINFDPKENEDGYTSSTYPDYTIRPTTSIPIYYEIQLDEDEVDNDRIVITNPDDTPVFPLHDVITNNWYENIDRQDEYEERYLYQRADRMYIHRY
ncbi:39765_t:CDS:2 [Gigaspora margarita]|uniref:39765_t:CDS:1 n=1 Tax=Gigaspora margarita TaxID=4874 RepID=A0ABN7UN18_GIGMA|nr:39765_t:CDS:2 [Gigaspora margarita]